MPVFQVHVPEGRFSPGQKRALGRALPPALQGALGLTRAICQETTEALGIARDDVFIALVPVPRESFSFGRGELQLAPSASDTDDGQNDKPA